MQPKSQNNASIQTHKVNLDAVNSLPMNDRADFADADSQKIADVPGGKILNAGGETVLDLRDFNFIGDGAAPDTVHPSLWRQSQVIKKAGLYKVVDHIYQLRNTDIADVTIVEGDDGLIIVDASASKESAEMAMQLFREKVNDKPVVAVIYTHTHIDHYGGVKGVVSLEDVQSGKVPIIAPGTIANFDKFALGENVLGGNAMSRRASYAFGSLLPHDAKGFVSSGIGLAPAHSQTTTYISPTDPITKTGEVRKIAGLTFEFLYAPDTEAPEEMHIWIPELKALSCAENANHSMHNIQTLRGARTRDARNFAKYLDETLERWGDVAEVHYGPHTWPVWGNKNVREFIESQRDMYKFIHDQSMRLANQGYSPIEAAEVIRLPKSLDAKWFNHPYHGTLNHNVKAVFAKELGWWNGNPVTLFPLPEVESAKRYVAAMGADKIMAEGKTAIDAGDYRWAVEILQKLVFAEPDNTAAKNLQADAYEQLGYQSEGPQWRNIFLTAAMELRSGVKKEGAIQSASPDTIMAMPMDILFDYAAIHVISEKAENVNFAVNVEVTDLNEKWMFWVGNGVLNARKTTGTLAGLTIKGEKSAITGFLMQPKLAKKLIESGKVQATGDLTIVDKYVEIMDEFDPAFNLVTP